MNAWRRLAPVFALLLVTAIPLWRAIFTGQAIGAFDQIRHMAPWNGPVPDQPWDVLQADSVLQFYPWRHMVLDAWGKHQLPLWNPYELAGTPLLANSQSGGFYPPHIALGLLHVPTALAMTLLAWFHLVLAGLGLYVLARRLGAGKLGAFVGGSSFSLSVFMLDWTALPSVPATVAWIPWLLAAVVGLFDGATANSSIQETVFEPPSDASTPILYQSVQRTSVPIPVMAIAGTAFCAAMMILAGHLQFAAYGFMAAVLFTVGMALTRIKSQRLPVVVASVSCIVALLVGGMMASPQLLPVLAFSKLSPRQNTASAAGYADYVKNSLHPFELANLTVANALGSPREDSGVKVNDRAISAYWPVHVKSGANLAESAVTIGPLVLGLLFLAPWKRRETWIVAALAGFALLLALGTPLNALLYYGVPGWSATGSPGRIVVLFVMGACLLAALAVDRAHESKGTRRLGVLALPLAIGGLFAALLPSLAPDSGGAQQVVDALRGAATSEALLTVLLSSVAGFGLALLLLPQAAKYRKALALFPLLIAWLGYASNLVPTGEPLPITENSTERVAIVNTHWGIPVAPTSALYPPNTASLSGIHELGGYDSLLDRDTVLLLEKIDQTDPARPDTNPAPPENGNMMFIKPSLSKSQLSDAGVTKIYWGLAPGANVPRVEDLPGPGRITGGAIIDDGYDHQTIDVAPGAKEVIVRDRGMAGWIDARNGQPVAYTPPDGKLIELDQFSSSGLWRRIDVDPNQTKIELKYVPPGLRVGEAIGLVGWILVVLCVTLGLKRRPTVLR